MADFTEGVVTGMATRDNGGFGNGEWIWVLVLFALFGGWGNTAGVGGGGAYNNYVLASDFATLQRQIDSATASLERKGDAINNGLCDGFYAMNTGLLNGFAGVTQTVTTNGYETRNAIQGVSSQLADCCCKTQSAIKDVNFNLATGFGDIKAQMATDTCALSTAITTSARDIIDNQNANYRAIHEELVAQRIQAKDDKIAEQQAIINGLQLSASQQAQNAYLINQLRPAPIPAYTVQNPYA
ncbi:MAG: hypothetical protein KBS91_01345, partial [Firmicutes bacterium]|nr:hypothetical protein [Candidatus Caballimonas caccae]